MPKPPVATGPEPALTTAIDLLVRQGYDTTSVDELADAAGISRSTFFRRFGSKDDMVFADHDYILGMVEEQLAHSTAGPLQAVAEAALLVFRHHIEHRDTSVARHLLLQQVPALRDRELVTSHRYERLFRNHLVAGQERTGGLDYRAVAVAAAVVAVHNAFLRQWFRDPGDGATAELTAQLKAELAALTETFRPAFEGTDDGGGAGGSAPSAGGRAAVMVALFPPTASRDEILRSIGDALPS